MLNSVPKLDFTFASSRKRDAQERWCMRARKSSIVLVFSVLFCSWFEFGNYGFGLVWFFTAYEKCKCIFMNAHRHTHTKYCINKRTWMMIMVSLLELNWIAEQYKIAATEWFMTLFLRWSRFRYSVLFAILSWTDPLVILSHTFEQRI